MRTINTLGRSLLASAAVFLAACNDSTTEPDHQQPVATYDLIFESSPSIFSNQSEIFKLRNGAAVRERIFPEFMFAGQPTASTTGGRIAYLGTGGDDGSQEIWVARADGTERHRLATTPGIEYQPALSPDGSRIAYVKYDESMEQSHIYVINADGSGEHPLTVAVPEARVAHASPAWSPDGKKIAFSAGVPGRLDLWVMNADGSNLTRLTEQSVIDFDPTWSPDGKRIAFARATSPAFADIVILDVVTRQQHAFGLARNNRWPAWSPDGSKIAFTSNMDGGSDTELYTVAPDGTNLTRLTDNELPERRPAWLKRS